MNHGAGWIVFEESRHDRTHRLLSILPARRNRKEVISFVQQSYVDRFASIDEKLSYKKHPESSSFSVTDDAYGGPIHVGHEPIYIAVYARKIAVKGSFLVFYYRMAVDCDDPFNPVFEERSKSIRLDA